MKGNIICNALSQERFFLSWYRYCFESAGARVDDLEITGAAAAAAQDLDRKLWMGPHHQVK